MTFQTVVRFSNHGAKQTPPVYFGLPCVLPIAQWLERPTSIWKVLCLILAGGLNFFQAFLSCS